MSAGIDPAKQQQLAAIEQRINEMVQQSRVLEAYMNDIMTRQVTVSKLMEEARLASTTIQNIKSDSEVESLMPVGIGVYVKTTVPPDKETACQLGRRRRSRKEQGRHPELRRSPHKGVRSGCEAA